MKITINWSGSALLMLVLAFACFQSLAAQSADEPLLVDSSVWGVYADLIGVTRQAVDGGYRLHWRWKKPGHTLLEEWIEPTSGKVKRTNTITLGRNPGELVMEITYAANLVAREWLGTVQPDGSVLYVGGGIMLKAPFLVRINEANEFEQSKGKLKDERLVNPTSTPSTRFALVEAQATPAVHTSTAVAAEMPSNAASQSAAVEAPPALHASTAVAAETSSNTASPFAASEDAQDGRAAASLIEPAERPAAKPDFRAFERLVGREFVSSAETVDIYRTLDGALALHFGLPSGKRWGRFLVRPAATPNTFELAETRIESSRRNRVARFENDDTLVIQYNIPSYTVVHRFRVEGDSLTHQSGHMVHYAFGFVKGDYQTTSRETYVPATAEGIRNAAATRQRRQAREKMEKRERRQASMDSLLAQQQATYNSLQAQLEVATAREAQSQAELQATLANIRAQAAAEKRASERQANQQRAAAANRATAQQIAPAPRATSSNSTAQVTKAQAPARTTGGTGSWETAGTKSSAGTRVVNPTSSSAPKRSATPEAIVVCTIPGAEGRFSCKGPVNSDTVGGPNNLSQWRTPELMVASWKGQCASARKLQSSSHLVWGCGYGATNNTAQIDRSAGVDVQGRRTYYCFPKQTSCRQTTP